MSQPFIVFFIFFLFSSSVIAEDVTVDVPQLPNCEFKSKKHKKVNRLIMMERKLPYASTMVVNGKPCFNKTNIRVFLKQSYEEANIHVFETPRGDVVILSNLSIT